MKRKIKFRVWDEVGKEFLRNCYIYCNGSVVYKNMYLPSDEIVFEQWTNAQDSNGKDIYEGDIVELKGAVFLDWDVQYAEIVWTNFCSFDAKIVSKNRHNGGCFSLCKGIEMKVVGNIHENPELIK